MHGLLSILCLISFINTHTITYHEAYSLAVIRYDSRGRETTLPGDVVDRYVHVINLSPGRGEILRRAGKR